MKEEDKIKQLFKSELGNYSSPVPTRGWDQISSSLDSISLKEKRKRLSRRIYMYSSAIAASIICFVVITSNLFKSDDSPSICENTYVLEERTEMNETASVIDDKSVVEFDDIQANMVADVLINDAVVDREKERLKATDGDVITQTGITREFARVNYDIEQSAVNRLSQVTPAVIDNYKIPVVEKRDNMRSLDQLSLLADNKTRFKPTITRRKPKQNLLTLNGGGGTDAYSQEVNRVRTLFRSTYSATSSKTAESGGEFIARTIEAQEVDTKTKIRHVQPYTLGLTFTSDLGAHLSLTSGLEYTYLHSYIHTTSEMIERNEEQSMHYLGVPLSLNYNIIDKKQFKLFFSAGGKIEKNVYGKRSEGGEIEKRDFVSSSNVYFAQSFRESGLQYSISPGVGVSFPIYNRINFYGKIGGAYYFRSKSEYKTIYSEKPFHLNVSLGVNISL